MFYLGVSPKVESLSHFVGFAELWDITTSLIRRRPNIYTRWEWRWGVGWVCSNSSKGPVFFQVYLYIIFIHIAFTEYRELELGKRPDTLIPKHTGNFQYTRVHTIGQTFLFEFK